MPGKIADIAVFEHFGDPLHRKIDGNGGVACRKVFGKDDPRANVCGDNGCRSKLAANCNAKAVLRNWMSQWHRVTVFGDDRKDLTALLRIKGYTVIEEDK